MPRHRCEVIEDTNWQNLLLPLAEIDLDRARAARVPDSNQYQSCPSAIHPEADIGADPSDVR